MTTPETSPSAITAAFVVEPVGTWRRRVVRGPEALRRVARDSGVFTSLVLGPDGIRRGVRSGRARRRRCRRATRGHLRGPRVRVDGAPVQRHTAASDVSNAVRSLGGRRGRGDHQVVRRDRHAGEALARQVARDRARLRGRRLRIAAPERKRRRRGEAELSLRARRARSRRSGSPPGSWWPPTSVTRRSRNRRGSRPRERLRAPVRRAVRFCKSAPPSGAGDPEMYPRLLVENQKS